MKIRTGFVSNSSSSSFIVFGDKPDIPTLAEYETHLAVPDTFGGEQEFGWTEKRYTWFGDKLNFAYLQVLYSGRQDWKEMLEQALKLVLHVTTIYWHLIVQPYDSSDYTNVYNGYIDHASCASENRNTEMFESKEKMFQFLFCDSYIQGDNDNK